MAGFSPIYYKPGGGTKINKLLIYFSFFCFYFLNDCFKKKTTKQKNVIVGV